MLARRFALPGLMLLLLVGAPRGEAQPPVSAAAPAPPVPDLSELPVPARRNVEDLQAGLAGLLARDPAAPQVAEGFAFLGRVLYAYELFEAAEANLSAALERRPGDLDSLLLRGMARAVREDFSGAADDFRTVASRQTAALAPPLRLGEALLALGRPEEARQAFSEALARHRPLAAAEYGLGRAAAALGDPAAAARHFETALSQQPSGTLAHAPAAEAYRLLGETDKAHRHEAERGEGAFSFPDPVGDGVARIQALTAFETVQEMAGRAEGFDEAELLDFVLTRYGRTRDALLKLRTLLARLDPGDGGAEAAGERLRGRLRLAVGALLLHQVRDEEAIPELEQAVALDPGLREARLQLADALARRGRFAEAVARYDELLALDPGRADALVRRAAARANLAADRGGVPASLRADFERAVAVARDPAARAEAHAALGRWELAAGRPDAALAEYRRALAADPEHPAALAGAAALLGASARYAEAASVYRRLADVEPRDREARTGEAVALLLAGEYATARARLEDAVAALPDDPVLEGRLARLLAASPDPSVRDGARAVRLAEKVFAATPTAEAVETLAMAYAEAGDFEQALLWQGRLLAAAGAETDPETDPDTRARRQRNLERYRSGRSCCAGDDDDRPGADER